MQATQRTQGKTRFVEDQRLVRLAKGPRMGKSVDSVLQEEFRSHDEVPLALHGTG